VRGHIGIDAQTPTQYSGARECLSVARCQMDQVKQLLSHPSVECGEQLAAILRQVEVQIGCAASILKKGGSSKPDPETRAVLEDLQREVAVLAQFFAETDKFLTGWLRAIQSKRAGYTPQGQAAPLMLVSKMRLEG
jgi:hypothetical protein